MTVAEPFILYASKRFMDKASKAYGLGMLARKPLIDILRKMGVGFRELDRDEAKAALERIAESGGVTVTLSQVIRNLALAFFLPTGVFFAAVKKLHYRAGAETGDGVLLEFLAEIPRAFKPTLFYDVWLAVPKGEAEAENMKKLLKAIVEKTGVPPLTMEEWTSLKPIIDKFTGKLEAEGAAENLWEKL